MFLQAAWAVAIFLLTYAFIVSEKIHRTVAAMLGALIVVAAGLVEQHKAVEHIDFNTLGLLIGMMIIVHVTAETGIFAYAAIKAAKLAKGEPVRILVALALVTALGSAFLDNVTTILLIVPVTFSITRRLKVSPIPFLITQVIASNAGGTATLIGDPPNIMIGSAVKELTFLAFIENLAPIIAIIMAVYVPIFMLIFRKQLRTTPELKARLMEMEEDGLLHDRKLLIKSLSVLGLTIAGFFLHQALHLESATVALAGAFILLLLTGERMLEASLAAVEWPTLFFFIGLFVLVGGLVDTGVIGRLAENAVDLTGGDMKSASMLILWLSAIASAFLDNIPFVATMIPLIQDMGSMGIDNLEPLWWSLALGACLGGNGTLIGASANLVAAGISAREGYPIRFLTFLKYGFPLMLLSVALSSVYVYLRYLL
ncbi:MULTISPECIES: ArsB/NhaD family transporter [Paenibacillus]|uniref:ArsB/NhaD family transporter n=1 Tax=Paenibacillus TaxID=44249 RepID=UPI00061FB142|nr:MULTISPECIES: ArsB/NhaD family transporter [Paenibacillus]KKC48719.1 membrane protein [Paenibacillus sp. D9]